MAKKVPRRFVPLDVNAALELSEVTPSAELMYYRMLQWAKRNPQTEGVVPDWAARSGEVARGIKAGPALASLENAGKIAEESGGWFIRVWFAFNPTRDDLDERQTERRKGAHVTNHKQGYHKKPVKDCPYCTRSQRRPDHAASVGASVGTSARYSDAEQESLSSLARATPSATAPSAEGAGANAHGETPNRPDPEAHYPKGWTELPYPERDHIWAEHCATKGWPAHIWEPGATDLGGWTDHWGEWIEPTAQAGTR